MLFNPLHWLNIFHTDEFKMIIHIFKSLFIIVMLKPIETEDQYTSVLSFAYEIMQMDLTKNSQAAYELDILCLLIKEYVSSCCQSNLKY